MILLLQVTAAMSKMTVSQGHGTIIAAASFDPETDAAVFRKAMKGIGNYFLFFYSVQCMWIVFWFVVYRYGRSCHHQSTGC